MKPFRLFLALFLVMLLASAGCKHGSGSESAGNPATPQAKAEAKPEKTKARRSVEVVFTTPAQPLYTASNIWYQKPDEILATNPATGTMIPAGTLVSRYAINDKGRNAVIVFESGENSQFSIVFNPRHFPGKTVNDIFSRMFTNRTLSERISNLSNAEIEGIRLGQATKGMSKDAVLISLGYPPEIRTSSTDQNTWTYWVDRFRTRQLVFGSDGRVVEERR